MSDRDHAFGRDCWCNPYVLGVEEPLILDRPGVIVRVDTLWLAGVALHVEPAEALSAGEESLT